MSTRLEDPTLVHGLGTELVPPDWPPVTLAEVTPVLAALGLSARAVSWRSPRPLSAAALVDAGDHAVFVKRHSSAVRDLAALAEEHGFARHLLSVGIPVPAVLGAVEHDGWVWEVHEQGAGSDTYRDTLSWQPYAGLDHAVSAGAVLARLTSSGYAAPPREPRLLKSGWDVIRSADLHDGIRRAMAELPLLGAALAERDWERDVDEVLAPLHDRLDVTGLESAWTHGDGHASNLLWDGPHVSAVLDLGLCDRTTPLLDLATQIERNAISWLDEHPVPRLDLVDALLTGWQQVRQLSAAERAQLPHLLPLVHVDFALSELGYFHGVVRKPVSTDLAYAYLVEHARWFTTEPGQELLAAVTL